LNELNHFAVGISPSCRDYRCKSGRFGARSRLAREFKPSFPATFWVPLPRRLLRESR
jgi:hypothetical protein